MKRVVITGMGVISPIGNNIDAYWDSLVKGVCGIAADSSTLYLPNNVLRECGGILKDWVMKNISL